MYEDTDDTIIKNWNRIVKKDDTVYHLGDFGNFFSSEDVDAFLKKLNGKKHLIIGNNDNDAVIDATEWVSVSPMKDILIKYKNSFGEITHQEVTLCHYAMKVWKHSGYGSWQMFGHSHGSMPVDQGAYQCDVGVMNWNEGPVSFFQIKKVMETRFFVPKDYHGKAGTTNIPEQKPRYTRTPVTSYTAPDSEKDNDQLYKDLFGEEWLNKWNRLESVKFGGKTDV